MTSKRKLRRRIEKLEDTIAIIREFDRHSEPPKTYALPFQPATGGNYTVRCTCPPNRGDNYLGTCPIHDVQSAYTWWISPSTTAWHA